MDRRHTIRADEELEERESTREVSPGKTSLTSRLARVIPVSVLREQLASLTGTPIMRKASTDASDGLSQQPRRKSPVAEVDPRDSFTESLGVDLDGLSVQAKGALSGPDTHETAAHGISASPSPLPHLDQIQRSFGHHDLGNVRAHVGGAARDASIALSAEAYAYGQHVAFKRHPDLHTAAHEAAHVVQQRGGVSLKAGVGEVGDRHERHADEVADRVVRGESAEALLDRYADGNRPAASAAGIQMRWGDPDDRACKALEEFIERASREVLQQKVEAWNRAVRSHRRGTVALQTDGEAVSVPVADARQAIQAAHTRLASMPAQQQGEEGEQDPSDPFNLPGQRRGRGYGYMGRRTRGRATQKLTQAAAYFRERGYEDYAIGTELFLRTMEREGYPSAINTYDGMMFTWGTGFAHGGELPSLWSALDPSVKSALAALVPDRVSASGVRVDESIQTELRTLGAFVQVSEGEHFDLILRAGLRTFLCGTMGLPEEPVQGFHLQVADADQMYLSTRLNHHRRFWHVDRDTRGAVALTGGVNPPDDTEYLAACIRLKTQRAIESGGGEGPGGRRLQTQWFDEMWKWRARRIPQWIRGRAGHGRHQLEITDRTRYLCPALTSSSAPFLQSVSTIDEIPANHFVGVADPVGMEVPHGRRTPTPEQKRAFLEAPRAAKFYDMGPVDLAPLPASEGGGPGGGGEGQGAGEDEQPG